MGGIQLKITRIYLLMFFCLFIISLIGCSDGDASNKQNQSEGEVKLDGTVELIVPASAGGGSDVNARMMAEVMKENKLIDENTTVVNKPGGSTSVANSYTYNKEETNNTILTWNSSQIISPILNDNSVTIDELTPLATLSFDSYLFVVKGDSKYKTFEGIVEAAGENPQTLSIGGTGQGTELHILSHLINKYGETEFKYVPFDSGGETISALLGGHVDVILSNPNEVLSQIEAGEVKALATSSQKRLSGALEDVPTFDELGYEDIKINSFRGYVGPPGMTNEEISFWEDVFKRAHETKMWQSDYIERYELNGQYLNAEESEELYQEVLDLYLEAAKEMELVE